MSKEELGALPINEISDKNCVLFLWGTWAKLEEAVYVIDKWDFSLINCAFVWVKLNPSGTLIEYNKPHLSIEKDQLKKLVNEKGDISYKEFIKFTSDLSDNDLTLKRGIYSGMGNWTNGNTEFCLFAKKGSPFRMEKNVKQIIMAPRQAHSVKPKEIHSRIVEIIGDVSRLEIFGREKVAGWDVIGNEVDGKDVRVALKEIIKKQDVTLLRCGKKR
jgi:N6-adenosine-specific RNA methylase IME4